MRGRRRFGPEFARLGVLAATCAAALLLDVHAQHEAPITTREASVRDWLARLDAAFAAGDASAYLACFRPDHPGLHDLLRQRVSGWLTDQPARTCRSELRGELHETGTRTVARITHEIQGAGDANSAFVEQAWLVLDHAVPGLQPVQEIELPAGWEPCEPGAIMACPPCCYRMGGVPGWLCVPVSGERSRTLESACFLLLGSDVACDLQVDVHTPPVPAVTVVDRLTQAAQGVLAGVRAQPTLPWAPGSLTTVPPGFTGSSRRLDLAAGQRADLFVSCLGPLSHALLLRGSAASLAAHEARIRELLGSYRLLGSDDAGAALGARALLLHTGSRLDGAAFANDRWRIRFAGPDGWTPQLRSGSHAFQCVWQSPQQRGRLWLTGYAVPRGMPAWTREAAERFLGNLGARAAMRSDPAGDWTSEGPRGTVHRTWVLSPAGPGADDVEFVPPPRRWLRAVVDDDLLVVVDGFASDEDDSAVQAAIQRFARR